MKAYKIWTHIELINWVKCTIVWVAFYREYVKYLCLYVDNNNQIREEWYTEEHLKIFKEKKIGFSFNK